MNLLTILLILLQISTFDYGNYNSSCSDHYSSYNSIPVEQTYRGIGYTTNYSNGQFNSGVYKSSMTTLGYQNRTFTSSYNPAASSSGGSRQGGGLRKSPQRPFSGETFEDFIDWLRIQTDSDWPSYVDDDYWDWFLENYPEYEEYVEQWFNNYPDAPNNPFNTPIDDTIVSLLTALLLYVGYDILVRPRLKK